MALKKSYTGSSGTWRFKWRLQGERANCVAAPGGSNGDSRASEIDVVVERGSPKRRMEQRSNGGSSRGGSRRRLQWSSRCRCGGSNGDSSAIAMAVVVVDSRCDFELILLIHSIVAVDHAIDRVAVTIVWYWLRVGEGDGLLGVVTCRRTLLILL